MANVRDLRKRIKSVGGIQQITRAMEMVATTKLRRYQDRAIASRPYAEEVQKLVTSLGAVAAEGRLQFSSPLFEKKEGGTAVFLITSDRGLCGAYNSNVFRLMENYLHGFQGNGLRFYVYGRKGYQYLKKTRREVERFFVEPALEKISLANSRVVLQQLLQDFESGKFAQLQIFYTAFHSMVSFKPTRVQLLPIDPGELSGGDTQPVSDLLIEPDPQTVFNLLVPKYLETKLFNLLIESLTSEFASRRMSMKNATDAAGDMKSELSRIYNRARQEGITKELLDIVGGAEALR